MELLDLYDRDRIRLHRTIPRGNPVPPGTCRLVVHVCLFNPAGEMLIQRRQPWKKGWPNLWDLSAGGCAVSGETSRMAAERETFEEIGFRPRLENARPALTVHFETGFDDFYLVPADKSAAGFTLQHEEVAAVKWASRGEIAAMIDGGDFIPYRKSFLSLLFELREDPRVFTPQTAGAPHRGTRSSGCGTAPPVL